MERVLIDALVARGETISFCESLSAGLACATLATVPGASAVLRGGLVTYATDLKSSLAGVPQEVLERYGAVHSVTARHMARGVRKACQADWGVALTGVAGPEMQEGHPVGEVFVAVSGPKRTVASRASKVLREKYPELVRYALVEGGSAPEQMLAGDRAQIRSSAVLAAFEAAVYEIGAAS